MTFHEVRFPTAISFHSSGGPERKTEIVTLGSGFEERNAVWANSRRRYNVGYGVRRWTICTPSSRFFEARLGRLYGFRFKDWTDFKSCAPGANFAERPARRHRRRHDDAIPALQDLRVRSCELARMIKKPVAATCASLVAASSGRAASRRCDDGTRHLRRPARSGAAITAGFEFDMPVRFDSDCLTINLSNFTAGEIPNIPLVEVFI